MQFLNGRGNPETKILNIFLLLFLSYVLHILCFVQKITVKRLSQGEICYSQNRSLWMTNIQKFMLVSGIIENLRKHARK
jgi:hypothetical protein